MHADNDLQVLESIGLHVTYVFIVFPYYTNISDDIVITSKIMPKQHVRNFQKHA